MFRAGLFSLIATALLVGSAYVFAHHVWHPIPKGTTIDRIVVEKSVRKLSIFANGQKLKGYRVALGRNPVGPKQQEGDNKTPEGIYKVDGRNPQSSFHLALHISYRHVRQTGILFGEQFGNHNFAQFSIEYRFIKPFRM